MHTNFWIVAVHARLNCCTIVSLSSNSRVARLIVRGAALSSTLITAVLCFCWRHLCWSCSTASFSPRHHSISLDADPLDSNVPLNRHETGLRRRRSRMQSARDNSLGRLGVLLALRYRADRRALFRLRLRLSDIRSLGEKRRKAYRALHFKVLRRSASSK